jgi:hypothetical protein
MAAIAKVLFQIHDLKRNLYIFDTYESMSEPTPNDLDSSDRNALTLLTEQPRFKCNDAPLEACQKSALWHRLPEREDSFHSG